MKNYSSRWLFDVLRIVLCNNGAIDCAKKKYESECFVRTTESLDAKGKFGGKRVF